MKSTKVKTDIDQKATKLGQNLRRHGGLRRQVSKSLNNFAQNFAELDENQHKINQNGLKLLKTSQKGLILTILR